MCQAPIELNDPALCLWENKNTCCFKQVLVTPISNKRWLQNIWDSHLNISPKFSEKPRLWGKATTHWEWDYTHDGILSLYHVTQVGTIMPILQMRKADPELFDNIPTLLQFYVSKHYILCCLKLIFIPPKLLKTIENIEKYAAGHNFSSYHGRVYFYSSCPNGKI